MAVITYDGKIAIMPDGKALEATGITPSGKKTITENGTYDVTEFASAEVNVSGGGDDPIPSAYTQLEYIESSGTQYIDTGVMPTENNMAEIDFTPISTTGTYYGVVSASTHMYLVHFQNVSSQNELVPASCWNTYGQSRPNIPLSRGTRYKCKTISAKDNSGTGGALISENVFGIFSSATGVTYTPTNTYYIFARNNGGGAVSYTCSVRLYSLKIYTSGVLRRDFVPAMRKSDNVIGLYDRVSDSFFTNKGTGVFTGGALS